MIKEWGKRLGLGLLLSVVSPLMVSAHEAYVLTGDEWQLSYAQPWYDFLEPLRHPANGPLIAAGAVAGLVVFLLSFLFWHGQRGKQLSKQLIGWAPVGYSVLRISVGLAILIGALANQLFGPEISLMSLPGGAYVAVSLYAIGILLIIGWLTELAGLAVAIIYLLALWAYGAYALHYLHYLLLAIGWMVYGAGPWSIDHRITPATDKKTGRAPFKTTWFRLAFALAALTAVILVKVMHPAVTLQVVMEYGIWPANPELFALAATAGELAFGLFLLLGFQTRTVAALFFGMLVTGQFFFGEPIWPHLPLYGMGIYLFLVGSGYFSFDHWLDEQLPAKIVGKGEPVA